MSDILLVPKQEPSYLMVPVEGVQADLVTKTGTIIYVPLASTTSPGIVQVGDGLLVSGSGLLSLDQTEIPIKSISKNGTLIVPDAQKNVNIVLSKSDVGLEHVDNTPDLNKPISLAQQAALNAKVDEYQGTENVDKVLIVGSDGYLYLSSIVGGGVSTYQNGDVILEKTEQYDFSNNFELTVDNRKVSIDLAESVLSTINNKVDKISGKGLSTEDYTTEEKTKLANIDFTPYALISETGNKIVLELDPTTYQIVAKLKDKNDVVINTSAAIDLPLESVVVNGAYDSTNKKIVLTLQNGNTIEIPVGDLVSGLQSEITSSNKLDADLVDDTNSTHKFVSASNKTYWDGKQDVADVPVEYGTGKDTVKNKTPYDSTDVDGQGNVIDRTNLVAGNFSATFGSRNTINANSSETVVVGGKNNAVSTEDALISGYENTASYSHQSVIGGYDNSVAASESVVVGESNSISGTISNNKTNTRNMAVFGSEHVVESNNKHSLISGQDNELKQNGKWNMLVGAHHEMGKNNECVNLLGWTNKTNSYLTDSTLAGYDNLAMGGVSGNNVYSVYMFGHSNDNQNPSDITHGLSEIYQMGHGLRARHGAQVILGKYNSPTLYEANDILSVGCGSGDGTRADCFSTGNDGTNDYIRIGETTLTEPKLVELKQIVVPTVNNPTIIFTQGGIEKGRFTLNQSTGDTIALDAGGQSNVLSDSQVDNVSVVSNSVSKIYTKNSDYNASTNKLVTENDIDGFQDKIDASHKLSADLIDDSSSSNKFMSSNAVIHDDTVTTANESTFADNYFTKTQVIDLIYPIGSIFISVNNVNPQTYLPNTTWVAIAAGQTLWTTTTNGEGGQSVSAGLPNIKGQFGTRYARSDQETTISRVTGNPFQIGSSNANGASGTGGGQQVLTFDASNYNAIYSDSVNTVQPPAIKVYMWRRTA